MLMRQNDEWDSSDEEWANAYAAMDPMTQHGWGTPQNAIGNGTTRLVRDVFVAADRVHEAALLEMAAYSNDEADNMDSTQHTEGDASEAGMQNQGCSEERYEKGNGPRGWVLGLPLCAWQRQCLHINP